MFQHIIEADWLMDHLQDENVRIVDCRFYLGERQKGYREYQEEHIAGAVYADLERHLSGGVGQHGGRHPLPDIDEFVAFIENLGISPDMTVVAYDSQAGAMASRFWWLMKYIGHDRVYVLNGGFPNWKKHSFPVSAEQPLFNKTVYPSSIQLSMLAQMEEVKDRLNDGKTLLIDSREEKRYAGIEEPVDSVAGHIPGAINKFWREALDEHGMWKEPEELQKRFAEAAGHENIIVYCGSGVTACPNVLALTELGFQNVKLYLGSWSDWITYEGNLIATDID
ncbi:sulfurtransferase [Bacillus songklensis]|uniref:Sulfurtransferase n=1 Tax=Bacillus songklensis TaxID=1069116 RepID=A0ABV8B4I0_9BACI